MAQQTEVEAGAEKFGFKMLKLLDDEVIVGSIGDAGLRGADELTLFKAGYLAGANDSFTMLIPRSIEMGRVLKTLYKMIEGMIARTDDMLVLGDLTTLHCEIARYLVTESESVLATSRHELSRKSGVLEEYIDNNDPISNIPHKVLVEIGRTAAMADTHRFGVFAVSGGLCGEHGTITFEELVQKVKKEGLVPDQLAERKLNALLSQYGAAQVRNVRKMYRSIEESLEAYKKAHESDAEMIAKAALHRISRLRE